MDEKRTDGVLEIDLRVSLHNFFQTLRRLLWAVVLIAVLAGGVAYLHADRSYHPRYACSAVFLVQASYPSSTDITSHSDLLDANTAVLLSETFSYVMESDDAQTLLRSALDGRSPATVTASATAESGLFTMRVQSGNAQLAYDTLRAAIDIYPQVASSILGDTRIEVINLPLSAPTQPIVPKQAPAAAAKAAALTLLVELVLVYLLALSRHTIHSASDLHELVNVKCFSYIPAVKLKKHSRRERRLLIVTNPHLPSAFHESIRSVRVRLEKAMKRDGCTVLAITSTLPGEGKSTVATNLALSLAGEGKRVLLMDGDLRKQSLKAAVGLTEPSSGLVDILDGKAQNFRLLTVPDTTLLLLSGDRTTDRPHSLLDSDKMRRLLEMLRRKLDYIIIDTPPAGILSDAATITKYTDGTLYVVRQDMASAAQILSSIQTLGASGGNLIGCVLNRTQVGTTRDGYGSRYGYGYGYGYHSYAGRKAEVPDSAPVSGRRAAQELTRDISDVTEK